MTGQLAGLGIMLVGLVLLLTALLLYNKPFEEPKDNDQGNPNKRRKNMNESDQKRPGHHPHGRGRGARDPGAAASAGARTPSATATAPTTPRRSRASDAKVYSTYYTTRKDNAWAKANPDEVQQCYIMTGFYTAVGGARCPSP